MRLKSSLKPSWSSSQDAKRQSLQAAQRVVETAFGFPGQLDTTYLPRQRLKHDFALESRQQLAHAHVDSRAEANVAQDLAFDVIFVRQVPMSRVPIGGPEKQKNLPSLL